MSDNLINKATIRKFTKVLHARAAAAFADLDRPGVLQLCSLAPDDRISTQAFSVGDVDAMTKAAILGAEAGRNVYVEGRTVTPGLRPEERGRIGATIGVFALVIDRDGDRGKAGRLLNGDASAVVETSAGNTHEWLFLSRALNAAAAKTIGESIRKACAADDCTGVPTACYRLPGTPNFPDAKKRERGRTVVPTQLVRVTDKVWTVDDLSAAFPSITDPKPKAAKAQPSSNGGKPTRSTAVKLRVSHKVTPAMDRSRQFQAAVAAAVRTGVTEDDLERMMRENPQGCASKYLADGDRLRAEIDRSFAKAKQWPADDDEAEARWSDPDISILDDRRGTLPEFPIETLSPGCQGWVKRAAHGAGVTAAHVAVPLISITASLIGTVRRVQAARSWTQPCTLWAAVVGFSGTGKTPGIDCVRRALAAIERSERAKVADMQHAHEAKVEAAKAARALWKKQVEEAASGEVVALDKFRSTKNAAPPLPPEAVVPAPFVAPRLFVSDSTIERLAVLLTARPRGMLYIGDELAGLFLNMSRYSGGSDREFWLESWNGGSFTIERMSREPIALDHLLVGLTGGFQPDKLARSFEGDCDGLYSRLLFTWPSEPPYRALVNDVAEVEPEIVSALERIVRLSAGAGEDGEFAPKAVPLSPEAAADFEEFRQLVHRTKQSLEGREREWLAKGQAHALRLAGTLQFLDWAFAGGAEPTQIGAHAVQAAIVLVDQYFWPHSRAALRQIGLSERHANARRALRWLASEHRDEFSREDIRLYALGRTQDADQTQALIDALVKAGWCREATPERKGAGRPPRRWATNPKLWAQ